MLISIEVVSISEKLSIAPGNVRYWGEVSWSVLKASAMSKIPWQYRRRKDLPLWKAEHQYALEDVGPANGSQTAFIYIKCDG